MAGRCKGKAVFMNVVQPCEHDAYDDEGYCTVHALLNSRAENQRLKEKVARYEAIFDCLETTTMPASKFKDYALSVIAHGPIEE